jgi:hypothetical protein
MNRSLVLLTALIILPFGCARMPPPQVTTITIDDIKVDNKSKICINVCVNIHNQCVKNAFGDAFALSECKDAYQYCTNNCPDK